MFASSKAPIIRDPPARELLGDLLLERNDPAHALVEYETSLGRTPGRFGGTYGAAHAAEMAGDRAKARIFYLRLETLAAHADSGRPELESMRVFLARKD